MPYACAKSVSAVECPNGSSVATAAAIRHCVVHPPIIPNMQWKMSSPRARCAMHLMPPLLNLQSCTPIISPKPAQQFPSTLHHPSTSHPAARLAADTLPSHTDSVSEASLTILTVFRSRRRAVRLSRVVAGRGRCFTATACDGFSAVPRQDTRPKLFPTAFGGPGWMPEDAQRRAGALCMHGFRHVCYLRDHIDYIYHVLASIKSI